MTKMSTISSKIFWIIALVLFALSAAFDALGGIGTVCAAFFPEKYPPLWPIVPYKLVYQIFMFVTIALGIIGVWVTLALIRGDRKAYKKALILLLVDFIFGGIRVFTSLAIRGKAAPTNINWYLHILTLGVFLLFLLPGLRNRAGFPGPENSKTKGVGASLASLVCGVMLATSPMWVAPSHSYQGVNWADVLRLPLTLIGSILILGGLAGMFLTVFLCSRPENREDAKQLQLQVGS